MLSFLVNYSIVRQFGSTQAKRMLKNFSLSGISLQDCHGFTFQTLFFSGRDAFRPHPPYSHSPPPRQCCVSFSLVWHYNPTTLDGGTGVNATEWNENRFWYPMCQLFFLSPVVVMVHRWVKVKNSSPPPTVGRLLVICRKLVGRLSVEIVMNTWRYFNIYKI